jgi:hypothetical protein
MKIDLKLALFCTLLGLSNLVLAQTGSSARNGNPNAGSSAAGPAAPLSPALIDCHKTAEVLVTKFKTDLPKIKAEHAQPASLIKNLEDKETIFVNREANLKNETLAQCQAFLKDLDDNHKTLLKIDVNFANCQKRMVDVAALIDQTLEQVQKQNQLLPNEIRFYSNKKTGGVELAHASGSYETLAACTKGANDLSAVQAELVARVDTVNKAVAAATAAAAAKVANAAPPAPKSPELDACYQEAIKVSQKLGKDIGEADKNKAIPKALVNALSSARVSLVNKINVNITKTVADCQSVIKEFHEVDQTLTNHLGIAACHGRVEGLIAQLNGTISKFKPDNATLVAMGKQSATRKQQLIDQAAKLGDKEKLSDCETEEKGLGVIVADINNAQALQACQGKNNGIHASVWNNLRTGLGNKALPAAKMSELKKFETQFLNAEKQLGKQETLAQCQEYQDFMTGLNKVVVLNWK